MKVKRVLIIGHTNTMGGVETFIRNVVLNSDKSRVDFDLLIHDGSGSCIYEDELKRYFDDDSSEHIIHVLPIKKHPVTCMAQLLRIRSNHRDDYDWIHLNTGAPTEIVYCLPLLFRTKAKLISHSHIGDGPEIFLNGLCRRLINRVSKYKLACSDAAAEWLFGRGKTDDVFMVRNGIETDKFAYSSAIRRQIRNEFEISDEFVVGHIGRFVDMKNHVRLLKIFDALKEHVKDAKLLLVGTGELFDDTVEQCRELGLDGSVKFLGVRNDTDKLYSAFDVFVLPSKYEGLPVVLVEAQAAGLPCIVSDAVSQDSRVIDELVEMIGLSESNERWAEAIEGAESDKRVQYAAQVEAAGFGIRSTAKALEILYSGDTSGLSRIGEE